MTNPSKTVLLFACLASACFFTEKAHANLLTNGSFELPLPDPLPPDHVTEYSGASDIPGWTIVTGSVDVVDEFPPITPAGWDAQDGNQSLDLNGSGAGTITQSFASLITEYYLLSFYYANNPYGAGAAMDVLVNGSTIASLSHAGSTPTSMDWTLYSYVVPGTGSPISITFASTTAGTSGIAIDNVDVSAATVPEPASMALLGIGAMGLAIGAIRRRRAA